MQLRHARSRSKVRWNASANWRTKQLTNSTKSVKKMVELEDPTPLLDRVYLRNTQRDVPVNKRIVIEKTRVFARNMSQVQMSKLMRGIGKTTLQGATTCKVSLESVKIDIARKRTKQWTNSATSSHFFLKVIKQRQETWKQSENHQRQVLKMH